MLAAAGVLAAARTPAARAQVAAGQAPPAATAPAATAPATRPATPPAVADVAGDLAALEAQLLRPDAPAGDREEAAARLVSRQSAVADERLREVLASPDAPRDARLAVARALSDDPTPPEGMIGPLGELMRAGAEQRSNASIDAAALALVNYRRNEAALDELLRFVADPAVPAEARARVVRLLGRVVEPAVAERLVALLGAPQDNLRSAAAEALAELTGIREFGQDARKWAQWQQQAANLPRDRWRADLLEVKAANLGRLRRRHDTLTEALEARMLQQYQAAPRDQRPNLLLSFLGSDQADERAIAARMVSRAFIAQDVITDRVRERLVALVGDSDPKVREDVATTLKDLNHRPALGAELTQLAQENEERVKVALIEALTRIEDPAAGPQLVAALLNNPSPRVFTAAATALVKVGRELRRTNPALADQAAGQLRVVAQNRAAPAATRAVALDALAALQAPRLVEFLQQLLNGPQAEASLPVRQAALRALGALGEPAGAEIATAVLRDTRDPSMRWWALDALGRTGNLAEHGGLLLDHTQRQNEPDESVRNKAWEAYQAMLPRASAEALNGELRGLRADPLRQAVVLEELCRKLEQAPGGPNRDELANFRVNLGDAYMRQTPAQTDKAIPRFRQALDHYLQNGAAEAVTEPLLRQLMDAYLKSKDYAQTATFGEQMITRDPRQKETVGSAIKKEADRLRTAGDTRGALLLIDEALKMDPQLEDRHRNDLRQIKSDIEGGPPPQ